MSSRTSLVLQKSLSRKGREGGKRREREAISCCCFTQLSESPGRLPGQGLSFCLWKCGWLWKAKMGCHRSWGSRCWRRIPSEHMLLSYPHGEASAIRFMFVCLLAFDGKHCEISFGALPVVNLCNVWVSNCHIYFLLSSRQVCVLFSPLLNIEGYHT